MAKRKNVVTIEQLCAALLCNKTIKEAAGVLGISEQEIHDMMDDNEFQHMYGQLQADILDGAVNVCQDRVTEAINCIADIMNDKAVNDATRLSAAQSIIKSTTELRKARDTARTMAKNAGKSPYDFGFNL